MKKYIITTLLALVSLASVSALQAAPAFGIVGYSDSGYGVMINDTEYNASITGFFFDQNGKEGAIFLEGNYKIPVDMNTALTLGGDLGFPFGDNIDSGFGINLKAGVQESVAANVDILVQVDVLSFSTVKNNGVETKTTGLFTGGRVGFLFEI